MAWIDRGKSGYRVRGEARIISMKAHLWCMESKKFNFLIIGLIERLPPAERLTSSLVGSSPLDFPNVMILIKKKNIYILGEVLIGEWRDLYPEAGLDSAVSDSTRPPHPLSPSSSSFPSSYFSSSSSLVFVMLAASLHHCRPRGRPLRSPLRRENSGGDERRDKELEGGMDGWMDGEGESRGEEDGMGLFPLRASRGSTRINHSTGGEWDSDG